MRRQDLCEPVRRRLKRLLPPTGPLSVEPVYARVEAASAALARVDALAAELHDPYLVSRVLTRREAVSSSAIEGTNSTLDELLSAEETEDGTATAATAQVRDYALILDRPLPRAREEGRRSSPWSWCGSCIAA